VTKEDLWEEECFLLPPKRNEMTVEREVVAPPDDRARLAEHRVAARISEVG
jgi:hypothetical protein